MSSNSHHRERSGSSSSTISAMSTAFDSNAPESEASDLSQSSQSSRIVNVPQNAAHNYSRLVIAKIEAIFVSMVDVLAEGDGGLSMPYRRRNSPQRAPGTLKFPGRNMAEATKFTQMIRIMELSLDALRSGRLITKRNIYYQNPELFKTQAVVDQLVDDLACTLDIGRNGLNIVAASKGLIVGPLSLTMADGSILSFASDHDNTDNIPPISTIHQMNFANIRWILVIEKEATFRTLAACQYWKTCAHGQGIIVTGKGYADLATLEFLNLVHTLRPLIPSLCVVDCDPHGIDIMRTYKHGSKSLGHEANTRVPGLQWLGVRMDDIFVAANNMPSGLPSTRIFQKPDSQSSLPAFIGSNQFHDAPESSRSHLGAQRTALDSLIRLAPSDRKTSQRILQAIVGDEDEEHVDFDQEDVEQLREIQVMLMLNMKAEIQAIDNMGDLSSWLDEKMGMA